MPPTPWRRRKIIPSPFTTAGHGAGVAVAVTGLSLAAGNTAWTCVFAIFALVSGGWFTYGTWWLRHSPYGRRRRRLAAAIRAMGDDLWADPANPAVTWAGEQIWLRRILPVLVLTEAHPREQAAAVIAGERHILWQMYVVSPLQGYVRELVYDLQVTRDLSGRLVRAQTDPVPHSEMRRQARAAAWLEDRTGAGIATIGDLDRLAGQLTAARRQTTRGTL